MYGAGFTEGSLARKGARGGTRGMGNKVISDKKLMEVGRMTEGDRGGLGRRLRVEGSEYKNYIQYFYCELPSVSLICNTTYIRKCKNRRNPSTAEKPSVSLIYNKINTRRYKYHMHALCW